jgi:hypothetical protein
LSYFILIGLYRISFNLSIKIIRQIPARHNDISRSGELTASQAMIGTPGRAGIRTEMTGEDDFRDRLNRFKLPKYGTLDSVILEA